MKLTEAISSLENIKEYFRNLVFELANDETGATSDRFASIVFNTYCALEVAFKPFKPIDDLSSFDEDQ
jgi:hypothetical protein